MVTSNTAKREPHHSDLIKQIHELLESKNGQQLKAIRNTLLNVPPITIAQQYLEKRYKIRVNVISNTCEYSLLPENKFKELNEDQLYVELHQSKIPCSLNNLKSFLKSDYIKEYNPFKAYFDSLPTWQEGETDYITQLAGYVKTTDQTRFIYHFKKHLVRTVACALQDGVINKQCLTFTGGQDCGKSYFCRFLCPPNLKAYLGENIQTDKDSLIALCENFIINLDELSTLSKADINTLKSFFSKDQVKVRRPYAATATRAQRVASFVGSTNDDEFLTDTTGSVRWLCFEVIGIDWAYSKEIDINQVWAQAYALLKTGFDYQLTRDDIKVNEHINEKYQVITSEMELVARLFNPLKREDFDQKNLNHIKLTSSEIINNYGDLTQRLNKIRLGKALKYYGFEQTSARKGGTGVSVKVWVLEKKDNEADYEDNTKIEKGVKIGKNGYPELWD